MLIDDGGGEKSRLARLGVKKTVLDGVAVEEEEKTRLIVRAIKLIVFAERFEVCRMTSEKESGALPNAWISLTLRSVGLFRCTPRGCRPSHAIPVQRKKVTTRVVFDFSGAAWITARVHLHAYVIPSHAGVDGTIRRKHTALYNTALCYYAEVRSPRRRWLVFAHALVRCAGIPKKFDGNGFFSFSSPT